MYFTDPWESESTVVAYNFQTPYYDGTSVTTYGYSCGADGCNATWTFHPGTAEYVTFALVPADLDIDAIPVEELNCHTVTTISEGEVSMEVVPGPDCVIDTSGSVEYTYRTWLSGHWSCSGDDCYVPMEVQTVESFDGEWHMTETSYVQTIVSGGGGPYTNVHTQLQHVQFCA